MARETSGGGKKQKVAKGSRKAETGEFSLSFFNPDLLATERLNKDKLEKELRKIADAARTFIGELAGIGDYKLTAFDLTLGASGNAIVVTVNGGIALHFEKPKAGAG